MDRVCEDLMWDENKKRNSEEHEQPILTLFQQSWEVWLVGKLAKGQRVVKREDWLGFE